ncbi:uncharacterized protein LOC106176638 isoform X1 [Lingula anatina]|uniref:Uncharacterized protein LOC106176638 isoform X1 n=1 Tax=Lingula anatina TaxID=7574 RepID=A0A1S3JWX3_LINAN|nr:uncharacterized protein LOC106176638 isoform X1 [Lingula anatina]|eukprot:XP_013414556.1 uncharacterized protein LOC106176638 isoform X1 [Lingula anatina]
MKTLAILIAMAATLATCDTLRCFSCSSSKEESCGESFRASSTIGCDTACFKRISTVNVLIGSVITYSRGCHGTNPYSMTCDKIGGGIAGIGADEEKCYCSTDLCNSASNLLPSIVQIVMVVAAAFFFQKF